jgi:hypothetical protein
MNVIEIKEITIGLQLESQLILFRRQKEHAQF